jgi:hypothetical protein
LDDEIGNNDVESEGGNPVYVDGRVKEALSFDGQDDYVQVPHTESLNIQDQIAISVWVKLESQNVWDRIVSKSHIESKNPWTIYGLLLVNTTYGQPCGDGSRNEERGQVRLELASGGEQHRVTSISKLGVGEWTHIVGTYNGTDMGIYINGILEDSHIWNYSNGNPKMVDNLKTGKIDKNDIPIEMARSNYRDAGGDYFNGVIDEVMIFNRSLSGDEIKDLYEFQNKDNF